MVKISEWYNKGLFLLTLYFVLDYDWVGYFNYFEFTRVNLIVYQSGEQLSG